MDFEVTTKISVKSLRAQCGVRYWEDAEVNGVGDEDGTLIPLRVGDAWCPIIDLETGIIEGWPEGVEADLYYKVCDDGRYALLDEAGREVTVRDGYVPPMLSPCGNGFGDYVIMRIDGTGRIENWRADLSYFDED